MSDLENQIKFRSLFFEESKKILNRIRELSVGPSNETQNLEIFRSAHTLKAMAQVMGFETLTKECHRFETQVKTGIKNDDWAAGIEKISVMVEREENPVFGGSDPKKLEVSADDFETIIELLNNILELIPELPEDKKNLLFSYLRGIYAKLIPARVVQISGIKNYLQRVIGTYQRISKKNMELIFEDNDVILEKNDLNNLTKILIQLVRNAATHGIESPSERKKIGKNEKGRIEIKASQIGAEVLLTISDDGSGLNYDEIRKKVLELNFEADEKKLLNPALLSTYIFYPNVTTQREADEFSGRGMGLNEVKAIITELGGSISVSTLKNKGTTFKITIPTKIFKLKLKCFAAGEKLVGINSLSVESLTEGSKSDKNQDEINIDLVQYFVKKELPVYKVATLNLFSKKYRVLFEEELPESESLILSRKSDLFWKGFTKEGLLINVLNLDFLGENY